MILFTCLLVKGGLISDILNFLAKNKPQKDCLSNCRYLRYFGQAVKLVIIHSKNKPPLTLHIHHNDRIVLLAKRPKLLPYYLVSIVMSVK